MFGAARLQKFIQDLHFRSPTLFQLGMQSSSGRCAAAPDTRIRPDQAKYFVFDPHKVWIDSGIMQGRHITPFDVLQNHLATAEAALKTDRLDAPQQGVFCCKAEPNMTGPHASGSTGRVHRTMNGHLHLQPGGVIG
ncbi:hypothetical protein [Bradyrhizobium sp. CCBAU 51765]|uniref:hypothetical protein n=1 Tax=Bradyrhizobium sp. CCBAU 51765 TaxID=1325102 RepID=UPI001887C9AF|nr:hypothetical protein [Bradyrhizobium sp. CCBAU 51765]